MYDFKAEIILDSISEAGVRITTEQWMYPRLVHSEFLTHREFSRSSMSSRAIPVTKMIEQVRNHPAMPVHWGSNQPGMQAGAELTDQALVDAKYLWLLAAQNAAGTAEQMMNLGLHKQVANRILEPFQWMQTIVTSTSFDNWDSLRISDKADPNINRLATIARAARDVSKPVKRHAHTPYVSDIEAAEIGDSLKVALVSAARCARVSYLNHDQSLPNVDKDLALAETLRDSRHASPFEHVAYSSMDPIGKSRNFTGWVQLRALLSL